MRKNIHGVEVIGADVDEQTRCAHYRGRRDIIAIMFKCCGEWYPCHLCHADVAGHAASLWPEGEFDTHAVLCGGCGHQLTVREYLGSASVCPSCHRQFNPGCVNHHHLYFEVSANVGGALVPRSSAMPDSSGAMLPIALPHSGQLPHSKDLRLHRLTDASATFFITKSLRPKKPVLDPDARAVVISAFRFAVEHERIYFRAFVVMPDHWHALFALRAPWTLPRFMHALMSYIGGKTGAALAMAKTSWQDGYYDTHVKTAKQFQYITYYIEQNPVVKEFVDLPRQWDATSARCRDLVTDPWPLLYD